MKKMLKLTNLLKEEMKDVNGGDLGGQVGSCYCGCYYANTGGSSSHDNAIANFMGGYSSPLPK